MLADGLKRTVDIVGAAIGLALMALPMAVIAVVVRVTLGRPVLFRQQRPGKDGRPFELVKFRTMRPPVPGQPSTDADRLTRVGRLLRVSSADELPELWCVLRGDMSLVGPRPLLVEYLDRYTPRQRRRHEVRPGLTGLAQVTGRNDTTWTTRLELDVRYVETRNMVLDLRIMARTVGQVVRRKGISASGHATMPLFTADPAATGPTDLVAPPHTTSGT